jgi:hypothetical protein
LSNAAHLDTVCTNKKFPTPGNEGDLGVVPIDDWRQGEHHTVSIIDHRIDRALPIQRRLVIALPTTILLNKWPQKLFKNNDATVDK